MKTGTTAPAFNLVDRNNKALSLKSLKGKQVVLFFYPKDDTPGCTIEAIEFSAKLPLFKKLGVELIGISGGDSKTKEKFCKKHNLQVTLLSDSDFQVAKSYGSFGPKTFMGRKYEGIFRKTFLIDAKGKIAHIFDEVDPKTHAEEVLAALKGETAKAVKTAAKKTTAAKAAKPTAATKSAQKQPAAKKVAANKPPSKLLAKANSKMTSNKPKKVSSKSANKK